MDRMMSLLYQPLVGSIFDIFVTGKMVWQLLLEGEKQLKFARYQILSLWGMVHCFSLKMLRHNVSAMLCAMGHGRGGALNHC
jgi:tryptophan-rich sensory protein